MKSKFVVYSTNTDPLPTVVKADANKEGMMGWEELADAKRHARYLIQNQIDTLESRKLLAIERLVEIEALTEDKVQTLESKRND